MRKWNKTAGLLFWAAASVYPVGALLAGQTNQGKNTGQEVRLLEETAGPVAGDKGGDKPAQGTSASAPQVNVSDAGTVEIHVNEANLVEVLRMLSLQSQKNIIASKEVRGTVTANLYNVTIKEALDAILKSNGFGYREKGNFIYVYTSKELADIEKNERQTKTEVFHLHYSPAANAMAVIKPMLSNEGTVAFTVAAGKGIESGSKDAGGDALAGEDLIVVRDYPENLEKVRLALKDVDRRPQQILLEATIMSARLTEDNALGVDFNILGGVDMNTLTISDTTAQITGAGVIPATATPGPTGGPGIRTDNPVRSAGTGTSFTTPITGGLKMAFLTSEVSVFVSALETVGNTTVLANPKVLALNKQRGEVLVGREDGYLTTTVTDTTTVQTVEFLKTGTRLTFRPYIGDDGYIRLEVHPEDSDGHVVSGLPSKTTTEVTSNVMVKDGHTIVIGGLFRESATAARSQIPFLGNIPIVGALFRNRQDITTREEIIILLTPHIIKDDAAYSRASEEAQRDLEKLRVGVRRGMMFFGRERLAESNYDKAVREMNKKNPSRRKAIWYLDAAINLNPTFLEAIKMKESLSGKEVTSVDNSNMRTFVKRQVMAERAAKAEAEEQELFEKATQAQPVRGVGDLSGLLPSATPSQKPLLEKGEKSAAPEKAASAPTEEITDETPKPDPDGSSEENK
jgi:type IV pilus assembly protein PilQ